MKTLKIDDKEFLLLTFFEIDVFIGVKLTADGIILPLDTRIVDRPHIQRVKTLGPPVYYILSVNSPWDAYAQIGKCLEAGVRHFIAATPQALEALMSAPEMYGIVYLKGVLDGDTLRTISDYCNRDRIT